MLLEIVRSLKLKSGTSVSKMKVVPLSVNDVTENRSHDPTATTTSEPSNQPAVPRGDDMDLTCRPLQRSSMVYSEGKARAAAEVLSTEDALALLERSIYECLGAIVVTLVSISHIDKTGIKYGE